MGSTAGPRTAIIAFDMAKAAREGRPQLGKTETKLYNFKVDVAMLKRWQTAADRAGIKLSQWLRDAAEEKREREAKKR